jgi:hypothetical protein
VPGRGVDLVVDGEELARGEFRFLVAVPCVDGHRLARFAMRFMICGTLSSGIGYSTVIG